MHGLGQPVVSRSVSLGKGTRSFCHVDACTITRTCMLKPLIITAPGVIGRRYTEGIA